MGLLIICHADFAACIFPSTLAKTKDYKQIASYYEKTLNTIRNHNGTVIVTELISRHEEGLKVFELENDLESLVRKFQQECDSLINSNVHVINDYDAKNDWSKKIEIITNDSPDQIVIGGGRWSGCLQNHFVNLKKYCKKWLVIPGLIYDFVWNESENRMSLSFDIKPTTELPFRG